MLDLPNPISLSCFIVNRLCSCHSGPAQWVENSYDVGLGAIQKLRGQDEVGRCGQSNVHDCPRKVGR